VRGTYAYQSRSVDPNWNLLLSNRWDTARGRFGALVNLSYTQLNYLDSARFNGGFIATAGAGQVTNPAQAGFRFPDGVGVFQGQGDRSRPSANAAFQWRPNDKLEIYADALYQGFRNRGEDRILFVPLFGGGIQFSNVVLRGANAAGQQQAQSLTATGAVRPDGFQGAADGDTDTYQFGVGAIYNMGPWRFSTDLATTDSVFELSVFSYDYAFASSPVRDVNFDVGEDGGVLFNFRNFDSTNPANYIFRGFFDRRLRAAGDDIQWRGDARFDTGSSLIPDVEFGVRYTDRNGQFDNGDRYAPQEGRRLPLTVTPVSLTLNPEGFRGGDGAQLPRFVVPTRDSVREGVGDLRRLVGFAEGHPPFDPVQAFTANEKAYAAYAQLSYEFDGGIPIDGSIGLRAVKTEISVTGTSRIVGPAGVTFQAANAESEYTDYLPSVTARFRFTDQLQGRLAANKTRTRPGFADYNPGLQVDPPPAPPGPNDPPGTRPRTARGGNIDLQPIESENYDAALEYYFSPTGSATVTAFRRDVDGFIVRQRERVTDPVLGLLEIDRPVNLNATKLQGVEAAFTTFFDFDFVPMWARGFGVQLNGTYIDHDGSINGISETSYNVVGMYEQGPLSARLAYNARSEFTNVLEIGGGNPGREYTEDVSRLDFSSSYTPRENITVTFDVSNILGKPFRNFREYRDQSNRALGVYPRDVRYEETIYSLGLRFRL
jgi:TonB-dependent receptor